MLTVRKPSKAKGQGAKPAWGWTQVPQGLGWYLEKTSLIIHGPYKITPHNPSPPHS